MNWITFTSFIGFSALVALGTWLLVRKKETNSRDGYFLAGRSLTFPFIAGSLLLTNLSTEQLVGLNGSAYAEGFIVMAWELVAVIALICMGLFFLPRFLRRSAALRHRDGRHAPLRRALRRAFRESAQSY